MLKEMKSADICWENATGLAQDMAIWWNLVEVSLCHYGIAELNPSMPLWKFQFSLVLLLIS